jgi:hypothetical protein
MRTSIAAAALLLITLATRLCHLNIVWVEEAYPAAAAIQMFEHGKTIYRDFVFDKPPGAAYFYRLFNARTGWPLRIAGTIFVLLCAALTYLTIRRLWGDASEASALTGAALMIFSLTFDHPAAIMAIAPDLLMLLPHLLALCLVVANRPVLAGLACGIAFWINPKAVFVTASCILWTRSPALAIAAVCSSAALILPFWNGWYEQVWQWGRAYSADPPSAAPLWEGMKQTGSWIWFHLALVVAACVALWKSEPTRNSRWTWLAMIGLAFAAVTLGLRFSPRYFFQILPLFVILAARGLAILPAKARTAILLLLLIPAIRFGRQYPTLALDVLKHRDHEWNQLALFYDSREIAGTLQAAARAKDTLFVWGYRPDILMLTRMPLGAPYLDSQPLNGVLADRHLTASRPSIAISSQAAKPIEATFVVDGLGLLNPALAFPQKANYLELTRTKYSILYRRIQ